MAIRGSIAKEKITEKILEIFQDSFINNKEIRIPYIENGEEVQIKVALTAAKENVENPKSVANFNSTTVISSESSSQEIFSNEPSEEEKKNLQMLINKLGL